MPIRKHVNQEFFSTWNPSMAYVLGFFAADGTMIRNNRGAHFIEFHITDKDLLNDIRESLKSNHKIAARKSSSQNKIAYRLQIGSKQMFSDLEHLGFQQGKSKILKLPKIPAKHVGDYVRGYFDGDGCVYFKKHHVRGRRNPRWVFQVRLTCGSVEYLTSLHALLHRYGLRGGFVLKKKRGYELVFSHKDGLALYRLMYNNAGTDFVCLARKKAIFDKAITTLYGL